MNTILSVMLVLLGFLVAGLLALILVPAYHSRTVRLTTERIRRSMPLTEAEIRADKDRIRAEYAIQQHRLSLQLRDFKTQAARNFIEINRRDAKVSNLERSVERLTSELEEASNARVVLEQTIQDRLPKVERRLVEARKLIFQRDRDIAVLTAESERTLGALNEAMQINSQQRAENARLKSSALARGAAATDLLADPRYDGEVALRAEIETLRAQGRDQSALIDRLQSALRGAAGALETSKDEAIANAESSAALDGEIERLRKDLKDAESALKAARTEPAPGVASAADVVADMRLLRSRNEDLENEVRRLRAELEAFEHPGEVRSVSLRDTKIALKARIGSLQAQVDGQSEIIQKLRAENAQANERLARQAAHFMEEMRRLGAGTVPASGPRRRGEVRRPLSERIGQVGAALAEDISGRAQQPAATAGGGVAEVGSAAGAGAAAPPRARGIAAQIRVMSGLANAQSATTGASAASAAEAGTVSPEPVAAVAPAPTNGGTPQPGTEPPRRSRLLERIADIANKS